MPEDESDLDTALRLLREMWDGYWEHPLSHNAMVDEVEPFLKRLGVI